MKISLTQLANNAAGEMASMARNARDSMGFSSESDAEDPAGLADVHIRSLRSLADGAWEALVSPEKLAEFEELYCLKPNGAKPSSVTQGAFLMLGGEEFPIPLNRGGHHCAATPHGDGQALDFSAVLAETDGKEGYVSISISPVHEHGCPAVMNGKKHGRCKCGAEELFREIVAKGGESWNLKEAKP